MGLLRTVVWGGESRCVIYECRRCGTTLDAGATACPNCDSTEIARFEIRR